MKWKNVLLSISGQICVDALFLDKGSGLARFNLRTVLPLTIPRQYCCSSSLFIYSVFNEVLFYVAFSCHLTFGCVP